MVKQDQNIGASPQVQPHDITETQPDAHAHFSGKGNEHETPHSIAAASSRPGTQADQSSDNLVPDDLGVHGTGFDAEKGNTSSRPGPSRRRPSLHARLSLSRSQRMEPPESARKRFQTYNADNPLSTWFARGRMMTGGDSPWSVLLVLMMLFGITGVWFGTTGVWYWRYAGEYGMARGSGVAIDIIFV